MKKTLCLILALALILCAASAALAAEEYSFSGTLEPRQSETFTAPFGGSVLTVVPKAGDLVRAGETLATLDVSRVYAPCDGVVKGLFAKEGDALADVSKIYAAPMTIEPASMYIINASTSGAHNSTETKYVHVGESVYVASTSARSRKGTGVVTSVSGTGFTVEVQTQEDMRFSENCYISRSDDYDDTELRIGSGRTQRNAPVAISADGSVLKLYVSEGAQVKRGDLLMETVQGDLRDVQATGADMLAESDCVVQTVLASAGGSVQQGQAMFTVYPYGTLEAVAQVDESDLHAVSVGATARIELDGASDRGALAGTVRAISYTPTAGESGVSYGVYVTFENDDFVRQGMNVTVVIGK